jgi:hypothetical protein
MRISSPSRSSLASIANKFFKATKSIDVSRRFRYLFFAYYCEPANQSEVRLRYDSKRGPLMEALKRPIGALSSPPCLP